MKHWKNKDINQMSEAELRNGLIECIEKVEEIMSIQNQKPRTKDWLTFVKDNRDVLNLNNMANSCHIYTQTLFDWVNSNHALSKDHRTRITNYMEKHFG